MNRGGRGGRGKQSRPTIVRCRCKSHCTKLNPATGLYEGDGTLQTRPTRDNHARDDRILENRANLTPVIMESASAPNVLQQVRDEIDHLVSQPLSDLRRPMIFSNKPEENGRFIWPNDNDLLLPNHGLYSLKDIRVNRPYLNAAHRLCELYRLVSNLNSGSSDDIDSLLDYIKQKMGEVVRLKEVEWCQQRGNSRVDVPYVNTDDYLKPFGPTDSSRRVSVFISLVMENVFFVPRRSLRTLLAGARSLLRSNGASTIVLKTIPIDPRSGTYRARLNPTTRQFVVCPGCHKLYPLKPGDSPLNDIDPFISVCVERRTPQSEACNTALWKSRATGLGSSYAVPIRKYVHQDLKSWFGRLLSRKGMEGLIDAENIGTSSSPSSSSPPIQDIWSAKVFQGLKDASGNKFIPGPPGEGRLVFSLSVDSFNPFHNKTAKQSVSSTGIWMVLLNLPPHLRYLHQNMYVAGVIPGPDKPSKEDIYPYLELVVEDLLEFWYQGVHFSRTESNVLGRLFKAMLVPLVCDMLAARQISGLSSATSHSFCTFCELDIDDVDVVNREEWPAKDLEHVRRIANLWKDAASVKEQESIFDSYGIRWSPLHTLPYWDVIRYTVIDPMHALDLNLFQNHCRALFQIDTKAKGGDGIGPTASRREQRLTSKDHLRSLRQCVDLIRSNDDDLIAKLLLYPRPILYQICIDNDIIGQGHQIVVGTKWILANNLVVWRNSPTYSEVVDQSTIVEDVTMEEVPGQSQAHELPADSGLDQTHVIRILRNLLDVEDSDTSRSRAYAQGSVATLLYICNLVHIPTNDVDTRRKTAKRRLFEKIINKIDTDDTAVHELQSYIPSLDTSPRPVLGIDVMEEIWADMSHTQLPTWITPAPPDWGTFRRGKLSADNWRVICSIHLPITLIRLWSNSTERKQRMLSHFMDLVSAIRIANMRITSPLQIQQYDHFMTRYISEITTLFPDQSLKPTHHASLHIGDMLGLFGPNHSHSGPHYERYINFFHHVNTNMKIGELEATMLNTSARSANIRALLSDDEGLRRSMLELVSAMDDVSQEDVRGFRLASMLDPESSIYTQRSKAEKLRLDPMHHRLLCEAIGQADHANTMPKYATFLKEISRQGVSYGISTASTFKNSTIMFQSRTQDGSLHAGIATHIFHYRYPTAETNEGHFFILQELVPIQDSRSDPYKNFLFGGFICQRSGRDVVIALSQVVSHCALTTLMAEPFKGLLHVLPLDRLMLEFDPNGRGIV